MRIYFAAVIALVGVVCMVLARHWDGVASIGPLFPAAGANIGWVLAGWRPVARRLNILAACLSVCFIAMITAFAGPDRWLAVLVISAVALVPGFVLAGSVDDSAERRANTTREQTRTPGRAIADH